MKIANCAENRRNFIGIIDSEQKTVLDIADFLKMDFTNLKSFLEFYMKNRRSLKFKSAEADKKFIYNFDEIDFFAPIIPPKLFCLAGNYREHIEEEGGIIAVQDIETPRIFMKPPSSTVIGPNQPIKIPKIANAVDWEGELAVVMGRKTRDIDSSSALDYVAGYTIMNDVSERKFKIKDRVEDRDIDKWFDWLNGKWFDTFAPLGPWIVTGDEIPNPQKLTIKTFVNGEMKQSSSTEKMIYTVADIIEYISKFTTLEPGDLISTGTIAGVGASSGTFLKHNDDVKIKISSIGELENYVMEI